MNNITCHLCGEVAVVENDRVFKEGHYYHNDCWEAISANRENNRENALMKVSSEKFLDKVGNRFYDQGPFITLLFFIMLFTGGMSFISFVALWLGYISVKSAISKDEQKS